MYDIKELDGQRMGLVCGTQPRVFFSLYYYAKDHAFKYAAQTWKDDVKKQENFREGHDYFLEYEVYWEKDVKNAWKNIYLQATTHGLSVQAGNIFSHASKQSDMNDGLEFINKDLSEDGTIKKEEIMNLEILPWAKSGFLILTGCNTGRTDSRGWCPARAFARRQKVVTVGQDGYAYFSKTWNNYTQKSASDKKICLWAFARGQNYSIWGYGSRLPGKIFHGV